MGTDFRTIGAQPPVTNRETSAVGRDVGTAVVAASPKEGQPDAKSFIDLNGDRQAFRSLLDGRGATPRRTLLG